MSERTSQATDRDVIRQAFVARFGEDQAHAVEDAAQGHYAEELAMFEFVGRELSLNLPPHPHATDNFGSSPFRYWFLYAIGRQCVTRFREAHGITATEEELREWALAEGDLGEHEGDLPDYIAIISGLYVGWVRDNEEDK